jgi:hypothetical protein
MKVLGWVFLILIGLMFLGSISSAADKRKAQDLITQNQWRSDGDISIGRALVKGGVKWGCGHFEYIQVQSSEYIVRCGFADEGYKYQRSALRLE